jgi:hypothetical protein
VPAFYLLQDSNLLSAEDPDTGGDYAAAKTGCNDGCK